MKQITEKQAMEFANLNGYALKMEVEYCQADWIKENARFIADIEMKRSDKTLCGEWPDGWKRTMIRESMEKAKGDLLARFLRDQCFQLDGALWLGNLTLIEEMEKLK